MCIQPPIKKMVPKQAIWEWEDVLDSLPGNKQADSCYFPGTRVWSGNTRDREARQNGAFGSRSWFEPPPLRLWSFLLALVSIRWPGEISTCLGICCSPKHDEEPQLTTTYSPPFQPCAVRGSSVDKGKHCQHFSGKESKLLLRTPSCPALSQAFLGAIPSTEALLQLRWLPNVLPRVFCLLNASD